MAAMGSACPHAGILSLQGAKFDADPNSANNRSLVDEMIAAMNAADPAVFALMDYWTFDGWFALKRRSSSPATRVQAPADDVRQGSCRLAIRDAGFSLSTRRRRFLPALREV